MASSQLQRRVSQILSVYFGGSTIRENCRPEWLTDRDGGRLELDFFIEEFDIGIEVQGAQHYAFVEHFHGSPEGFGRQLQRDRAKRRLCEAYGVTLFEVSNESEADELVGKIRGRVGPAKDTGKLTQRAFEAMKLRQKSVRVSRLLDLGKKRPLSQREQRQLIHLQRGLDRTLAHRFRKMNPVEEEVIYVHT